MPKAKAAPDPVVGRIVDSGQETQQLLKMGVRAEQRAFAKFDPNFVIDRYLPEKLRQTGKFLP